MDFLKRTPVQVRSEDKLARVLATAQMIVVSESAEAATTTRIARDSGVAVGTIYRYFSNREGVLNALVNRELDELDRRLDEGGYKLGGPDWRKRAATGARIMVEFTDDPTLAYRTLMYTSTLTGEIAATNRDHDLRMARHLLKGLPRVTVNAMAPSPLSVIHVYLGILDKGLELAFYREGCRDDLVLAQMNRAALGFLETYFRH